MLSDHHHVQSTSSAKEALHLITQEYFDLILCDLMMPQMTGVDFFSEVKKLNENQANHIGFMSGGAYAPQVQKFIKENPMLLIEKPFMRQKLLEFVDELMHHVH